MEHTLLFEGVPQSRGRYEFTVFLYVDPPMTYIEETGQDEDGMCSQSTSKSYVIVIH